MLKILGTADILAASILFLIALKIQVPWILVFIAGAYLLLKSLIFIFSFNLGTAFDLLACLLLFLSLFFAINILLLYLAAILVLQKGVFSLL